MSSTVIDGAAEEAGYALAVLDELSDAELRDVFTHVMGGNDPSQTSCAEMRRRLRLHFQEQRQEQHAQIDDDAAIYYSVQDEDHAETTVGELRGLYTSGAVGDDTEVWAEGLVDEWTDLGDVKERLGLGGLGTLINSIRHTASHHTDNAQQQKNQQDDGSSTVNSMSVDDVGDWLRGQSGSIPLAADYAQKFVSHRISGLALLELSLEDLRTMGVVQSAHRAMLLQARNRLLAAAAWTVTDVVGALREFCADWIADREASLVLDVILKAGIDGAALLQLTDPELVKLGLSQLGIRKTVARFVKELLNQGLLLSAQKSLDADMEQEALYVDMEGAQDPAELELRMAQESPMAMALRARQARHTKAVILLQATWRGCLTRRKLAGIQGAASTTPSRPAAEFQRSGWRAAREKMLAAPQDKWKAVLRLSGVKMQTIFSAEAESFSYHDFRPKRFIAKGAFGRVFLVELKKRPGHLFAVKCLSKERMRAEGLVDAVMEERKVLEAINRLPFVVKFLCAFQSSLNLYLVQDFYAGGEFLSVMKKPMFRRGMPADTARFYSQQILCALRGIHRLGIVYRDLKPENCLIDATGNLALTDFGTAVMAGPDANLTEIAGTLSYMAPECLACQSHGQAVDMWSFGVMLYEMLAARLPFTSSDHDSTRRRILKGNLNIPQRIEVQPSDLIRSLLTRKVVDRLDVNACMDHAFFGGTDWPTVLRKGYTPPVIPTVGDVHGEEAGIHEQEELLIFRSPVSATESSPRSRASRDRVISWHAEAGLTGTGLQ